jgi:hypothetical protein
MESGRRELLERGSFQNHRASGEVSKGSRRSGEKRLLVGRITRRWQVHILSMQISAPIFTEWLRSPSDV